MVCINGLAVCDMEHSVVVEHFQSCDNVKLLYIPSKYLEVSTEKASVHCYVSPVIKPCFGHILSVFVDMYKHVCTFREVSG